MHNSELLSTLFLAYEDLHKISENLSYAAQELQKRGEKIVSRNDKKRVSVAPNEYLEADAVAWSAETLEVISCQLQAIHKRIENNIKPF